MRVEEVSPNNADERRTNVIKGAAVSASLLCLVHCLALPVLLLVLPGIIGLFAQSAAFHYAALALVIPVTRRPPFFRTYGSGVCTRKPLGGQWRIAF